jgi:isoleucyl-tRNA synthetase
MIELDRWAVDRARLVQAQVIDAYERYEFHHIYHKVHNFCVLDMGGFYLDIIKDRLYTTPADSLARRSAQTAMFYIAEAMVRWLAPILSFTAEEIWRELPGGRAESVFLASWHEFPPGTDASSLDWAMLLELREAVSKELERLRVAGQIGSPLDAVVAVYCADPVLAELRKLGDELRFVLITSGASVQPADERPTDAVAAGDGLWLGLSATNAKKCVRCWHRRADVGADKTHPDLCERCVGNVAGPGEHRAFA